MSEQHLTTGGPAKSEFKDEGAGVNPFCSIWGFSEGRLSATNTPGLDCAEIG